jgi:WD40 repeat protein
MSVNRVTSLAFLPDGNSLSGEIEGSGIKVWDVRTGEVKKRFEDQANSDSLIAMSAAGTSLAEAGVDRMLRLWNLTNEQKRELPWPGSESASALAISTAGQLLATATDKEVTLWNAGSGERMLTLSGHETLVNRLVFSPDDRSLISADEGGTIKVWDTTSGQNRKTVNTGGKVTAMRLAPGGQWLASAGEDRSINLWDLAAGGIARKLKKHDGIVNAIAFSADGQLLASGSDDRTVIIWETATGKSKRTLKGHDLTVLSVAFSPDGSLIASGSGNASVVLWEVKSGKLNRVLH